MISAKGKNVIEESVKAQYSLLHPEDTNLYGLKQKINRLCNLIEVYLENQNYKEKFAELENELERVSEVSGRMDLSKISCIDTFSKILEENNKPNIIKKAYSKIFEVETVYDLKSIEEKVDQVQRKDLLPYAVAIHVAKLLEKDDENNMQNINIHLYWEYISNMFLAYLEIANKLKDNIMEMYVKLKINVDQYLNNIIVNYKSKTNFKYIPSSVIKLDFNSSIYDIEDETEDFIPFLDVNKDISLKRIKLIGYAGAGKTTTLEYIEYEDAECYNENKKIPVLISLCMVNHITTIEKLICEKLGIVDDENEIINYLLEKNKINLYLDGVNEISLEKQEKREVLNEIEKFVNSQKTENVRIIATDRDNDDISILNNVDTFLIEGMTEKDIKLFIDGNSTKVEKKKEIEEKILQNKAIQNMRIRPLMLKELISIVEYGEDIPEDMEEITEKYLKTIIKREIEEKHEEVAKYIDDALSYLVEKSENIENSPMSYYNIIDTFNEFARNNNLEIDSQNLLDLIKKIGIFKEVDIEMYLFSDESYFMIYYYKAN